MPKPPCPRQHRLLLLQKRVEREDMETERRALNAEETAELSKYSGDVFDWKEWLWSSLLTGSFLGIILALPILLIDWLTGRNLAHLIGQGYDKLPLVFAAVGAACFAIYTLWDGLRFHWIAKQRRANLLVRTDLLVERHHVEDCKFVREDEHGQRMYFLRTSDQTIIFIFEDQDLDHCWEEHPLEIPHDERPRNTLKIIRDPASDGCVLSAFLGEQVAIHECFKMDLPVRKWPTNGAIIAPPWETLDKRFGLKTISRDTL